MASTTSPTMTPTVSVVIPTHNRCASLLRTLESLNQQSYSSDCLQVVVVANGCEDDTMSMLQDYSATFSLVALEQPALGAAAARNLGAQQSSGTLLIFLDDDIEVSSDFVSAHVGAHLKDPDGVVMGYLPSVSQQSQTSFFQINLRSWWESKFQSMRDPAYRFTYQDLLSGNFSLSAKLFQRLGGFNADFFCKEDYELGLRLIKAGIDFRFAYDAWGYHHEVTDFKRSLKRKFNEGIADVQLGNAHPDIKAALMVSQLNDRYTRFDQVVLCIIVYGYGVGDLLVHGLCFCLKLLEWFQLRDAWEILYRKIYVYWYLRGVTSELGSLSKLSYFLAEKPASAITDRHNIVLALEDGLKAVGNVLDQQRPYSALVYYKQQYVGYIEPEVGAEALRSVHLKTILISRFSWQLVSTLSIKNSQEKSLFRLSPQPQKTLSSQLP